MYPVKRAGMRRVKCTKKNSDYLTETSVDTAYRKGLFKMHTLKLCPECQVPEIFTSEHLWLDNGEVVQRNNQHNRVAFFECENIGPLFSNLGELIGLSIEPIVIEIVQRGMRAYLSAFIPDMMRQRIKNGEMDLKTFDDAFRDLARPAGYGNYQFVDMRFKQDKDDYFTVSIQEPYSLPICVASHAAALEAILGFYHGVTYTEVSPGIHNITAFPSEHPKEFRGRLRARKYNHIPGNVELERCGTCGGPKALSDYKWYPDRGVVLNTVIGRRMAIMGGALLDPLFEELETELDESIGRNVVEAQRRFSKTGFYSIEEIGDEGNLRAQFALRGLGNLQEINMRRKGVHLRLDNSTLHLLVVGLVQGLYELAFDVDSDVEWEFSENGDLDLEVTPQRIMVNLY
jgi:hypothetical protein